MNTRKTIALIRWTLVGKVMSLLFHKLYRLGITFLPRRRKVDGCSDLVAQNTKVFHCFHGFPSICHDIMGPDAMILAF